MRRLIGSVLLGLGVFLVVAAALMRFYMYPSLAQTPEGYNSTTYLEGEGVEIFNSDPEVLAPEVHDLAITSETRENVEADVPDDATMWVNLTTIVREDGVTFQQSTEQVAFDVTSGAAIDCEDCDTWDEVEREDEVERVPVTYEGQIYKFPFNTQKQDYEQWDGTIGEATTATYEGEEEIEGLTVYKFVQVIEPTVVETREVPGSVFGSKEDSVEAEMVYGMTRTLYIEPGTGSPVNRVEERTQELVYDDVRVPAFVGTVGYTDDQVSELVDDLEAKGPLLNNLRGLFPLLSLVLGVLAIGGGLLLHRGTSRNESDADTPDRPLVSA